jgi:hypothetical protein
MADLELVRLLARGASAWNQHRPAPPTEADLTHLEIRRASFRGADFRQVNLDGSAFRDVDFGGSDFRGARLNGVNATRTSFEKAALCRAEFKGSDFKQVCLRQADLREVVAFEWKIRHSALERADLGGANLEFMHVYNSDLTSSTFEAAALRHVVFKRAVMEPGHADALARSGAEIVLANQPTPADWIDWRSFDVRGGDDQYGIVVHGGQAYWIAEGRWDFFISHASVDKDAVARPLAAALEGRGMRVWYDELQVRIGDDLARVIEFGTKGSLFGVIVLSRDFMGRRWTEAELAALLSKRLFVVLHGLTPQDIATLRPEIQDKVSLGSELGADRLADALVTAVRTVPREMQ